MYAYEFEKWKLLGLDFLSNNTDIMLNTSILYKMTST